MFNEFIENPQSADPVSIGNKVFGSTPDEVAPAQNIASKNLADIAARGAELRAASAEETAKYNDAVTAAGNAKKTYGQNSPEYAAAKKAVTAARDVAMKSAQDAVDAYNQEIINLKDSDIPAGAEGYALKNLRDALKTQADLNARANNGEDIPIMERLNAEKAVSAAQTAFDKLATPAVAPTPN